MSKKCERKLRRQELILKVESQRYELGQFSHAWLESMKPMDKVLIIISRFRLPLAACGGILIMRQVKKQSKTPLRLLHYIRKAAGIWTTVQLVHRSFAPKR